MSAFLLLANHSNTQYQLEQLKKEQRRKKRHSSSSSSRRSHKSNSSSASTISSSTSTSSSSSSSKENSKSEIRSQRSNSVTTITSSNVSPKTNKLVFDINTSSYIPAKSVLSEINENVSQTNTTKINNNVKININEIPTYIETSSKYNHLNHKLNQFKYINEDHEDHERLFTLKNIQLLRYSYFEQFIVDHTYIKNNEHKCEYMHIINNDDEEEEEEEIVEQQELSFQDDVSYSLSNLVIHEYEEDLFNSDENRKQKYYNHKPLPSSPAKRREAHEEIINVSKIFKSNQFWNSVYQDIKFENYEMYQNLPLLNKLQSYMIDYVEYFFLNLNQFDQTNNGRDTLFYFNDLNYQYFNYMNEEIYHDMFKGDINQLTQLIIIMVDNLKLKISNSRRLDKLYNLWQIFLNYSLLELTINPSDKIRSQNQQSSSQVKHQSVISNNSSIISKTSKTSSVSDISEEVIVDEMIVNNSKKKSSTTGSKKISLFSKFSH
ncbi:hypothetical protein DFJ63DRAFT_338140 [Scheffersomyces coipomensis]|uniref:uncharacterized protein n=1 Tax=Scheffersomyces coipomensis TaxID=1788519 RepID=UPI00315D32CD